MSIESYIEAFTNLKTSKSQKIGEAPHKPIFLLTLMELINNRSININYIELNADLISSFKYNWMLLVETKHFPQTVYPFFHLRSSNFWHLIPANSTSKLAKTRTVTTIRELNYLIDHAEIDDELFYLIRNNESFLKLRDCLLNTYFSSKKLNYLNKDKENNLYLKKIENELIKCALSGEKTKLLKDEDEKIRSKKFRELILRFYKQQCAISETKIISNFEIKILDACHIIPFKLSYNDNPTNGIALTPSLHRAFDRGLMTIDEKYKVVVSDKFKETYLDNCGIKKFDGKIIILPDDKRFYPSLESLNWHRENIFIK